MLAKFSLHRRSAFIWTRKQQNCLCPMKVEVVPTCLLPLQSWWDAFNTTLAQEPPINKTHVFQNQTKTLLMKILGCTNLGLGGVVLLDDGPVFPIQTVSDPELLHKDVPFAVLPSLNHHTAHHLVLAEIHLPGTTRKKKIKTHSRRDYSTPLYSLLVSAVTFPLQKEILWHSWLLWWHRGYEFPSVTP